MTHSNLSSWYLVWGIHDLQIQLILGIQIYLTRKASRGHHSARRAREPESTVLVETGASEEKKMISNLRPYSHYELAVTVFNSKGEGPLSEMLSFMTPEGGENMGEIFGMEESKVVRLKLYEIWLQMGNSVGGARCVEGRAGVCNCRLIRSNQRMPE